MRRGADRRPSATHRTLMGAEAVAEIAGEMVGEMVGRFGRRALSEPNALTREISARPKPAPALPDDTTDDDQQHELDAAHAELAPADDYTLEPTDQLVVIARNWQEANSLYSVSQMQALGYDDYAATANGRTTDCRRISRNMGVAVGSAAQAMRSAMPPVLGTQRSSSNSMYKRRSSADPETPADVAPDGAPSAASGGLLHEESSRCTPMRRSLAEPSSAVEAAVAAGCLGQTPREESFAVRAERSEIGRGQRDAGPSAPKRNAYLLVGWIHGISSLLFALDRRAAPESEVYILSEKPLAWRDVQLAVEGLARDGSPHRERDDTAADDEACANMVRRMSDKYAVDGTLGLRNLRLKHIVGFPTDELAIRRLPLRRAVGAIVSADVDTTDVDTQITDSEVLTSAHLLRRIYEPIAAAECTRYATPRAPLSLVIEFNDVLTKRLLEAQPRLLEPRNSSGAKYAELRNGPPAPPTSFCLPSLPSGSSPLLLCPLLSSHLLAPPPTSSHLLPLVSSHHLPSPPRYVDVLTFHRQYLETASLALSAHSYKSWATMCRLLDAHGGADLARVPAAQVLEPHELLQPRTPYGDVPLDASESGGGELFSFHELSVRVAKRGRGVLVGWQRQADVREMGAAPSDVTSVDEENAARKMNPVNKAERLPWSERDMLIVVERSSGGAAPASSGAIGTAGAPDSPLKA
jgi:hypothetical protein